MVLELGLGFVGAKVQLLELLGLPCMDPEFAYASGECKPVSVLGADDAMGIAGGLS